MQHGDKASGRKLYSSRSACCRIPHAEREEYIGKLFSAARLNYIAKVTGEHDLHGGDPYSATSTV